MILEILTLAATGLVGLGAGLLIGAKSININNDGSPKVKVLKLKFSVAGDVFINMIEYENKRTVSYVYKTSSYIKSDEDIDNLLRNTVTSVYNYLQLWLNFDTDKHLDVSDIHGASYV